MRTDDATMEQQEKDVVAVMAELTPGRTTTPGVAYNWLGTGTPRDVERTRRVLKRLEKQGAVDSEQRVVGGRWAQVWWLTEGAR